MLCNLLNAAILRQTTRCGMALSMEKKDVRIQLVISQSEIDALDEWRAQNKIWSRSDAIRQAILMLIKPGQKPDDGGEK